MVTIKEIARECNVSATTVSNILNGKPKMSEQTRQMVLQVVKEKGYQPNYIAQGLRRNKTQTIGIIAEDISQFTTPSMVESIMEYCESKGYRTIVQNLRLYGRWRDTWFDQEDEYREVLDAVLQEFSSLKVDGIIYLAGHARINKSFPDNYAIPIVMAYAYTESSKIPSVVIDDTKSSYEMNKYLLSMGHRRIGVVAGRPNNIHTKKRLLGYQEALYSEGVPFNPGWVRYGDWERGSGYEEAKALVDEGVTAIFCMADRMAGGVYDYLEEQGLRVGIDISVAGFDNQDIAEYFRPSLTTMALPLSEIGRKSAEILLRKLDDSSEQNDINEQVEHNKQNSSKEQDGELTIDETTKDHIEEIYIPCTFIERKSVVRI